MVLGVELAAPHGSLTHLVCPLVVIHKYLAPRWSVWDVWDVGMCGDVGVVGVVGAPLTFVSSPKIHP